MMENLIVAYMAYQKSPGGSISIHINQVFVFFLLTHDQTKDHLLKCEKTLHEQIN